MKKLLSAFALISLFLTTADADEQATVDRCTRIIRDARQMPETNIPRSVLRQSKGVAIMTVVKAAFIFSGKGGHGVVVARTPRGWSGPSFIGTGGAGWGLQAGAQATDFIFILNNNAAVRAFSKGGNVTLGADASVAAGPVGRDAQVAVAPTAAIYAYSRTKGLFAGASLEGSVLITRKGANERYYRRPVASREILNGRIPPPPGASRLRTALGR
jgi:lipid-binding SYLF domain-containing protein